jgi:hypothetical protein
MAGIAQVNGQVAIGSFYGPEQLMIKIADSGNSFTANSGGGTTAIVEGGFSKAIRAIETVASVLWVGTRTDATAVCVIVDANTVNRGDGVAGSGVTTGFGALKAAIVSATGATLGNLTVTSGTTFANTGAFTLA